MHKTQCKLLCRGPLLWHGLDIRFWMLMLLLSAVTACASPEPGAELGSSEPAVNDPTVNNPTVNDSAANNPAANDQAVTGSTVTPTAGTEMRTVIFLGDSLTAGYGLDEQEAFPHRIGEALASAGDLAEVRIVNAGVSGDTTAGGLRRLDWLLRQNPDVLVLALGANDGLRALDPVDSEQNLRRMIIEARESGSIVLLAGMLIPPNYGPDYTEAFAAIYPRLADELDVPLIPFLLEGVAGDPSLNQADGIHPTAEGQLKLAQTVLKYLKPILVELDSESRDLDS